MKEKIKHFFRAASLGKYKISFAVFALVALTLPATIGIISFYGENLKNNRDVGDVMTVSVYDSEKKLIGEQTGSRSSAAQSSLVGIFDSVIREISEPFEAPAERGNGVFAVITQGDAVRELMCYFSFTAGQSFCTEKDEVAYRISDADSAMFLSTPYSETLYGTSRPPNLYNAYSDVILPADCEWQYKAISGKFFGSTLYETTDTPLTYTMAGEFGLYFDQSPDTSVVRIYEEGQLIFSGSHLSLSSVTVSAGRTLSFKVYAEWKEDEDRDFAGSLTYDFLVHMRDLSAFSITRETGKVGEICLISATHIDDISKIKLSFDPPFAFPPQFFTDGITAGCIIPFRIAGDFKVTVTYGAAQAVFRLNISSAAAGASHDFDFPRPFSEFSAESFMNFIKNSGQQSGRVFVKNSFAVIDPAKFAAGYSYGDELNFDGEAYTSAGTEFVSARYGETVSAIGGGVVVFAGHRDFGGNTVIIDHGYGLKTVYSGLGALTVSTGDFAAKGDIIGQTGDSTVTGRHGFVLHCAVFGEIIDPAAIIGVNILDRL